MIMGKSQKSRRVGIVSAISCAVVILAACSSGSGGGGSTSSPGASSGEPPATSGQTQTVKVAGLTNITASAPFIVASEKGYFTDAGLKVEITTLQSGQNAVPLLSSGRIDAAIGGVSAGMFNSLSAGLGFRYVGDLSRTSGKLDAGAALFVSTKAWDSGEVRTIADLKGKKIAIAGGNGATGSYMLSRQLEEGGLTLADVDVQAIQFADMEAGLKSGAFVAAIPAAPFDTKIENDGVGRKLAAVPTGVAGIGVEYGQHFISERPKVAQAFFDAMVRAAQDLQGDKAFDAANLEALAKGTGGGDTALAKQQIAEQTIPAGLEVGDTIELAQKVFMGAKLLDFKELLPMSKVIDNQFWKAAGQSK